MFLMFFILISMFFTTVIETTSLSTVFEIFDVE